jgi:hypothetical protein
MLSRLNSLYLILNGKTFLLTVFAVIATYVCMHTGLRAEFPLAVVTTAVVFPIVFSINAAYQRRETALSKYADMKAHAQVIYYASRDWMPERDEALLEDVRGLIDRLLRETRDVLGAPVSELREREGGVYRAYSDLSLFVRDRLRAGGLATGELSRCNQYVSKMLIDFESIKHIYQYRTPLSLRSFSDFFIVVLPVLYAPYFAAIGSEYPFPLGYVPPLVLTLVLVSLDNIQEHLENPFDQMGEDDIVFDVDSFMRRLQIPGTVDRKAEDFS